jgi:Rap1a immunity proteins
MKTPRLASIVLVLSALVFAPVNSQARMTGNEIMEFVKSYDQCEDKGCNPGDSARALAFMMYVTGVIESPYNTWSDFLLPPGTTRNQIYAAVSKYFKEHPEMSGEGAAMLVMKAIIRAFPNNKSKEGTK